MGQDLSFIAEQIAAKCPEHPIWVAFSGGVDSHVLLHLLACSELLESTRLHAVHVNHSLHVDSQHWAAHCQQVAANLEIDFHCVQVVVNNIPTLGLEAAARQARYQAIAGKVPSGSIVLTAQHQEDQAETLLLQLLRGAGVKGLSSMAFESLLEDKQLQRPLLEISQTAILAYADQHKLTWVEDPSNTDTCLNRNYLRHRVWPSIVQRWPSAAKSLSRSASYCAESDDLLSELAALDLLALDVQIGEQRLPISALLSLSPARARNLIRYVLAQLNLTMPPAVALNRILDELCPAAEDKTPVVTWANIEVRRYQDSLYFLCYQLEQDMNEQHLCSAAEDVLLSDGRQLTWFEVDKLGISEALMKQGVRLGFRQGGEVIQLAGHGHHKSLKHLCQEWAIPPWERGRIPLLFQGDTLLVVVGYGLSEQCVLSPGQKGYFPLFKTL